MPIVLLLLLGAASGLIGAFAMYFFMRSVSAALSEPVDMIEALGSFFTGTRENAHKLGTLIHVVSGIVFGTAYVLIFNAMEALLWPHAFFLGIGFGFFHGLIMSYVLMFYACERHPIEEYRNATLEEGLLHLVGHILFGAAVGLIGGLGAFFLA